MTDTGPASQDRLMAELRRVGTQQESLKKAVAEAMSSAKEKGESFSIAPTKSSLVQQTQPEKAASQTESEAPGIAARWTKESMNAEEASAAAMLKVKHAAVQQVQQSDADARADSLPEQVSREQVNPMQSVPEAQAIEQDVVQQDKAPEMPKQSAAAPELLDNSDVLSRRLDLSKMQVALGHEDTSGATEAAFKPAAYTLGFLPSQGDTRSKEQKKEAARNLAQQRKEEKRLKKKQADWKKQQQEDKEHKADEEAAEVRNKLLAANLGPTPSTAGGQGRVQEAKPAEEEANSSKKSKWWKLW